MTTDIAYFGYDFGRDGRNNVFRQEAFIAEVRQRYPNVKLRDIYNEVKGLRHSILIDNIDQDEYFAWMISRGWAGASLQLSLLKLESESRFMALVKKAKRQYPSSFEDC